MNKLTTQLFLLCFVLLSFIAKAQQVEILDPNFQAKNFRFEHQVFIPEMGTKGVLFIFDYQFTSSARYLQTFPQFFNFYKYGINVYSDSSTYFAAKPNEWHTARKFIPYRALNLAEGKHNDVEFQFELKGAFKYTDVIKFEQPYRYAVDFEIHAGSVKQQLNKYDPGEGPDEWDPDSYWTITSGDGEHPAFKSKTQNNSFALSKEQVRIYVLEGEKLFLNFYDEDGAEDTRLGRYELTVADKDFKTGAVGRMFDNITGLEFSLAQHKMIRQPITTYVRHNRIYNGRKGVELIFDYFLPQAIDGQVLRPQLEFSTKNDDIVIQVPYMYNLDESPKVGQKFNITKQGKLSYFVPYYAWNSNIQTVKFSLAGADKVEKIEAAPYFIHTPIGFDRFISYSGFFVDDNYKYMGTSGVKVSLSYRVNDINKYSNLEVNFLTPEGGPAQYDIYPVVAGITEPVPIDNNPLIITQAAEEDTLEFFIPYMDFPDNAFRVEMNMVPDMSIPIIHETTPYIEVPEQSRDAALKIEKQEAVFKEGDYGYVVTFYCKVPAFYKERCMLDIQAKRNGGPFPGYSVISDMVERVSRDTFKMVKTEGTISIIFPYRRLMADDKISLSCQLVEKRRGRALSELAGTEWKVPSPLYNIETSFTLDNINFDALIKEKGANSGYKYVLMVGNEPKLVKTIPSKIKSKDAKKMFNRTVRIHREDLIQIKVVSKDEDNPHEIYLWSGDLGKFQQNGFKGTVSKQSPIKSARVSANLSKKQLKFPDNKEPAAVDPGPVSED